MRTEMSCFPLHDACRLRQSSCDENGENMCLQALNSELNSYLSDTGRASIKLNWVRNLFSRTERSSRLPTRLQKQLMDVCGFKIKHTDKSLS